MIQLKSYFWCTYLFLKKMPWYFYATTTCESEIYLTKQEYLNQYFVLTAPERCILIFSQCCILLRDLVANNFVINNSSNRSVHIPISPEVIKYNYYLLRTYIFNSKIIVLHRQCLTFGAGVSSAKYILFSWPSTV